MKFRAIYAAVFAMAMTLIGSGLVENILSPRWRPNWLWFASREVKRKGSSH